MATNNYNDIFPKYREHSPTQFDHNIDIDRSEWYLMPVSRTRDSGILENCNFDEFLEGLGGESETVELRRFGHWGPGWYEIIIVDPSDEKALAEAYDMANRLENYPILNEDKLSELEWDAACEEWLEAKNDIVIAVENAIDNWEPHSDYFVSRLNYLPESLTLADPDLAEKFTDKYFGDENKFSSGMLDYESTNEGISFWRSLREFQTIVQEILDENHDTLINLLSNYAAEKELETMRENPENGKGFRAAQNIISLYWDVEQEKNSIPREWLIEATSLVNYVERGANYNAND